MPEEVTLAAVQLTPKYFSQHVSAVTIHFALPSLAVLHCDQWQLEDLVRGTTYNRKGSDLQVRGLYLDEPPWRA